VSDDITWTRGEIARVAADAFRHLAWLRDTGVREIVAPLAAADRLHAAPVEGGAVGGSARPSGGVREESTRGIPAATATSTPSSTPTPTPTPTSASTSTSTSAGTRTSAGTSSDPSDRSEKGCGSPDLLATREALGACTRCQLAGGRTRLVYGVGNPHAELMFVGEGPGADEDREGEPFVGRAGQLLTRMIEAMGLRREQVYIANVVKCRPPGNRNPEPEEMDACEPFLRRQIAAVRPKVIVALGKIAAQRLLADPTPISRLRGRWFDLDGVRLMPTFHPAYLLRSPDEKKKAWEDLQLVMKELGRSVLTRR
jgi:DNA polymerase